MLVLFTDFGWQDPYVGQMKAVLVESAPGCPVIDLLHGVPDYNAHAGAHLLAALATRFPPGTVFVCVVDPGVGSPRQPVVVEADGRYYVGPDNGLLSIVAGRAKVAAYWRITWRPESLSSSFHGRDMFAPIAAEIAAGRFPDVHLNSIDAQEVVFDPTDLPRIVYIDHYGNAWTGIRAGLFQGALEIEVNNQRLQRRSSFHEAAKGEAFWYENSVGLIEIAVNRGHAGRQLDLTVGNPVKVPGVGSGQIH